jgi:hypothetical protein
MINIGNIGRMGNMREATLARIAMGNRVAAQASVLRSQPRGPGMPLAEAQRQLAQLKARNEKSNQAHRAEMRRRTVEYEDFEPMPRVDAVTHDIAQVWVAATFGPLDRQERFEQRREVGDSMRAAYERNVPFLLLR